MAAGVEDGGPSSELQGALLGGDGGAEGGGEGEAVGGTEGAAHVGHNQLSYGFHQRVDSLVKA